MIARDKYGQGHFSPQVWRQCNKALQAIRISSRGTAIAKPLPPPGAPHTSRTGMKGLLEANVLLKWPSQVVLSLRNLKSLLAILIGQWSYEYFAGLMAPTFLKRSVDSLSGTITQAGVNACVAALAWSGVCRVVNSIAREAQGPIFTPVAQVCLALQHIPRAVFIN